jgi:signal transduction histidine kinase
MNLRLQLVALAVLPLVIAILSITTFLTWQSASLARSSIAAFEQNSLAAKKDEIVNLTSLAMSAIQAGLRQCHARRRRGPAARRGNRQEPGLRRGRLFLRLRL